tara:strand:- start:9082 stop:10878 length:1797 start_codon:yes stop_codon:yes gene_type:complete
MVKSYISLQNVIYKEEPYVDPIDRAKELIQYRLPLFEFPNVTIATGTKCTEYEKKGIIYHYCYLISNNKGIKIGVFEFPSNRYESYLDIDNPDEIMCSRLLPHLLLFDNARDNVIQSIYESNAGKTLGTLEPYKLARLALPHVDTIPFSLDMVKPDVANTNPSNNHFLGIEGLQTLKSTNLINCIANAIHNVLKMSLKDTIVYLYGILSDHITISMFDTLKSMHIMIEDKLNAIKLQNKELKQQIVADKKKIKQSSYTDADFQNIIENIKLLKQQSQFLLLKQKYLQNLLDEKEYMRHIDTLDDFKAFIKSGDYICEPWTIEILERLMNVKLILISTDMPQWLVCSRQSPFPHNMSLFNPLYYILLEFTGNNYTIIEVNSSKLLTFQNIPLIIKDTVINRCLENSEGVYASIPLFVKYKQFKLTKEQLTNSNIVLDLEPDKDIIVISDLLKKIPYPGGVYTERMDFENVLNNGLVQDKSWREKLCDNYIKPDGRFKLGDKEWSSVNHYVTSQELKQRDPAKSDKLSITSGSILSKKTIPYMDLDNNDRYSAVFAKFSQNPLLKDLLMQTGDANLYMYVTGKPPVRLLSHEKVRNILQN